MLELKDLTAHYGKNEVVSGANIVLNAGEVVALIGANAAGKSTTMRLIAGLKKPTRGTILFNGQDIVELPTPRRVSLGIILVPEGRQVFVRSSVIENLAMGAYHRPDRNRIEDDLQQAFAMFPRLAGAPRATRRIPVGWRTADACYRAGADGPTEMPAARRANAWPGAGDR